VGGKMFHVNASQSVTGSVVASESTFLQTSGNGSINNAKQPSACMLLCLLLFVLYDS